MILPNTADALESWHFNFLIFDELHTYPDSKVWGRRGQGPEGPVEPAHRGNHHGRRQA